MSGLELNNEMRSERTLLLMVLFDGKTGCSEPNKEN